MPALQAGLLAIPDGGRGRNDRARGAGDGERRVLPGARRPLWECRRCRATDNWACRIVCRCGAGAPGHVVKAARANERDAGGSGGGGRRGGASSNSNSNQKTVGAKTKGTLDGDELQRLRDKVRNLEKERDSLRTPPAVQDDAMEDEAAALPAITELLEFHRAAVAAFGDGSEQAGSAAAALDDARKAKTEAKPLQSRVRDTEALLKKKKKQRDDADAEHQTARAAVVKAQEAADKLGVVLSDKAAAVLRVEEQLADLRRKQLQDAAAPGPADGGAPPAVAAFAAVEAALGGPSASVQNLLDPLRQMVEASATSAARVRGPRTPSPRPGGGAGEGTRSRSPRRVGRQSQGRLDDILSVLNKTPGATPGSTPVPVAAQGTQAGQQGTSGAQDEEARGQLRKQLLEWASELARNVRRRVEEDDDDEGCL